ncbi:hypothetical protein ACFFWD_14010 [Bradyrhizobium erythrophlei]|uniref:hypothetical protein n=1 Tax=Bradyrhizobium erythrophlei TaxID=1437360 RepID=UPI0035EA3D2C
MMKLFLVAVITSVLDITGAAAASTAAASHRCSQPIEFNDPGYDRLAPSWMSDFPIVTSYRALGGAG